MENVGQLYDKVMELLEEFNKKHKTNVSLITLDHMYSLECFADGVDWKNGKTMPTKEELYWLAELCWDVVCDFDDNVASDDVARVVIYAYEESEYTSVEEFVENTDREELGKRLSYC